MGSVPAMNAERGSRGARRADLPKKKTDPEESDAEIWKLVRPRRWLLLFASF